MLRDTLTINSEGRLEIGGADCRSLAREFGTPLYVMDEAYIRRVCRAYNALLKEKYPNGLICYASKAFSAQAIYTIVGEEGLGADVVSGGELYTAATAGFDLSKVYFHGNNKLPHEIETALRYDVHAIVVDGFADFETIREACRKSKRRARVLVRVNPGIEAHTHQFIQTTKVDSKFGVSMSDGTAQALIEAAASCEETEFLGIHCHIGSQIFELTPFAVAVDKFVDFAAKLGRESGITVREMNFGGGYGIRYLDTDKPYEPEKYVETIVDRLVEKIDETGIAPPRLILEPGRSIVGEAGVTLYTVGAIKEIKGVKKYLAVDGGMFENPRPALYGAEYEACLAERMTEERTERVSVAGKCCESGDILIEDVLLPPAKRGDLLAVFSTGAYNYAMASHYNRNPIPPVVLVDKGRADYIVRPETYEDLIARDVIPARLKKE